MIHTFTLLLAGPDPNEPANLDRLFEIGCDDAVFGSRDGVFVAEFQREATSFSLALQNAIVDVESAVPGLRVIRVEPEELVTASEVAERTQRSRESIRQLSKGMRGSGDFPKPVAWLSDRQKLWNWAEVCEFFESTIEETEIAKLTQVTNAILTLRSSLNHVNRNDADITRDHAKGLLGSISRDGFIDVLSQVFVAQTPTARKKKRV